MGPQNINNAMEFYKLTDEQRRLIFRQTSAQTGINANLIEKDWWVCVVLRSLYSLPYSKYLSFKRGSIAGRGGTCL